ncbi:MAG: hypothetical protein WDM89_18720 [Rhizomicrobium sp.]
MARLLAKGWVVFCLFAGAYRLIGEIGNGAPPFDAAQMIGTCTLLFAAMGLLFVGGYASATDHGDTLFARLKARNFLPPFNDTVFLLFVTMSLVLEVRLAPQLVQNPAAGAIKDAIFFAVPGQRELEDALAPCGLDGGRIFSAAFVWFLAIIYLASAASRLRLAAGLIRLERVRRPEAMGGALLAFLLGALAITGFQLLYMGSAFQLLPCSTYTETSGELLLGLGPLMLAYVIVAALTNLLAMGPE